MNEPFNIWIALGLFAATVVTDVLFVIYTYRVIEKKAMAAAINALALELLAAVGIISYVANPWYLVPVAIGSFLGTFAAVAWEKRRPSKQSDTV